MKAEGETNVTDIELTQDGRIFVFGASAEVLSLLDELGLSDEALRSRIRHLSGPDQHEAAAGHRRADRLLDKNPKSTK